MIAALLSPFGLQDLVIYNHTLHNLVHFLLFQDGNTTSIMVERSNKSMWEDSSLCPSNYSPYMVKFILPFLLTH